MACAVRGKLLAAWLAGLVVACVPPAVVAQFAVSESGQPGYVLPIDVPPGIAGLQPKLALQYSPGATGGPLGEGWALTGLSAITRCGSTIATDGVRKGIRYTAEDRLCLDGQRLILTDAAGNPLASQAAYGTAGTEYRTEKESHARIRLVGGTAAAGPGSFKVWTKAGLLYEYGATADSRILTVGRNPQVAMAWAVNRVSDTAGNTMTMEYEVMENLFAGSRGREWSILRIRYTGHRNGQAPFATIEFGYRERPDASEAWHEGGKTVNTRRLTSVRTYVGASGGPQAAVLAMVLAYAPSQATGRSLLESVRVCTGAGDSKCLPATRFTYTPGPGLSFTLNSHPSLMGAQLARLHTGRGVYTRGPLMGDFTGDGRQDLLVWDEDPSKNQLLRSVGDGSFVAVANPVAAPIGHGDGCHYAVVADFNLDGISDLLQVSDRDADVDKCGSVQSGAGLYLGSPSGVFQPRLPVTDAAGQALPLVRADPRYVGGWTACLPNEPADSCTGVAPLVIQRAGRSFTVADINGDGTPDLLFTSSPAGLGTPPDPPRACPAGELTCIFLGDRERPGVFTRVGTSLAQQDLFSPKNEAVGRVGLPGTYAEHRVFIGDLNADGLPDILVRDKGDRYIATGTSGQYVRREGGVSPCMSGLEVLDVNGDGKWDLACLDPVRNGPYQAYVNDGAGNYTLRGNVGPWVGSSMCNVGSTVDPSMQPCEPTAYRGRMVYLAADLNGDGVSEVLAMGKRDHALPGSINALLRGQRDGSYQHVPTNLDKQELSFGVINLLAGDFTGRGAVEFLRYSQHPEQGGLFLREEGAPADLLKTISSPQGAQTILHFQPLTAPSVYQKGTGAGGTIVDLVTPQWVVARVDTPDGRGGHVQTHMRYTALRADLSGRGGMGFATVEKTTAAANGESVTSWTSYRQDFPFAGLPAESRHFVTSSGREGWHSRVVTSYVDLHASGCTSPKIFRPLLAGSTEHSRDLNRAPISSVETTYGGYNCHGDVGTVTVRTTGYGDASRVYTRTTTNTWLPARTDGEQWILGRLATATQTNSVPASLSPKAPPTGAKPTLQVEAVPDPLVAGKAYELRWSSTHATAVAYRCTAAGAGFKGSSTFSTASGSTKGTALEAWVDAPSNCTWTATGPGGTHTVTHTLTTVRDITLQVQASPSPLVAGQAYQITWSSTGATQVGYKCTASNGGFAGATTLPTANGSSGSTALEAWVGNPSNCLWTATGPAGSKTLTHVLTTVRAVDLQVSVNPDPMVAGKSYRVTWSSSGATQVGYKCTANGGGFNGQTTLPTVSGSSGSTALDAWVGNPSTCLWTATGPLGSRTITHTLRTVRETPPPAPAPVPTLSVQLSRNPFVAGEAYQVTWASTNATSVAYQCTAAGSGFQGSTVLPTTSGTSSNVAPASWVGYPSSCVWTATGPGGSHTLNVQLTTVAPKPTISVRFAPFPLVVGQAFSNTWTTTNATSLRYQCSAAGPGFAGSAQLPVNGTSGGMPMGEWVAYPSTCVWTASGPGGTTTYTHSLITQVVETGAGP